MPNTLDWYRMIGERLAVFRMSRGASRANAAEPGEVVARREALVRGAEVGIEQRDVPLRHFE